MKSIFSPSFVTLPLGLCKLSTPASVECTDIIIHMLSTSVHGTFVNVFKVNINLESSILDSRQNLSSNVIGD